MSKQADIPVLIPYLPTLDAVLPYLQRIDQTRRYTNFGPLCLELEQRFRQLLASPTQKPFVCSAANATLGLEIALLALGLKEKANVLIPALTFVATATSVRSAGHEPVFADVDPHSWQLTPALARACCKNYAIDCVMPVATYGTPLDVNGWDAFAAETGIPVLIDAAGALGNQLVGSRCHVVYSLHATKILSSVEGAIIASMSETFIDKVRRLSNFGIDLGSGQIELAGTNAKLSEYHAAVGLASLDAWDVTRERRRFAWQHQHDIIRSSLPSLRWQQGSAGHVHTVMPILLPDEFSNRSVQHQLASKGIETRAWYCPPLPQQPAFARHHRVGTLEVSQWLGQQLLGLPFHLELTPEHGKHILAALTELLAPSGASQ